MGDGAGTIRVDLREGFEDDLVVIRIGEEEVMRKTGVTTLPQIGRADGIDVPIEGSGPVTVSVELPMRGVSAEFSVPAPGMHLGVSVDHGTLTHEVSEAPFRYA